jgi:CheY-like chemotaxis protein
VQLLSRKRQWPTIPRAEIMKRARILVVDDGEFPYLKLFKDDGYTIQQWKDVIDLAALENGEYDLILLDLRGVGRDYSSDEGLGILKHIRETAPAQIVIAYSNSDLSLDYQPFFRDADATLHKTKNDYVEYKRKVDALLERKFSLGFYLDRIGAELDDYAPQAPKARKKARDAILSGNSEPLQRYLTKRIEDAVTVDRVIALVGVGAEVASLWKT